MGLFLNVAGVIGSDGLKTAMALKDFAVLHGGGLENAAGKTTDEENIGVIYQPNVNTTVLFPGNFAEGDDASKYISQTLGTPVLSFHIHDGAFWMYALFQDGNEIDAFNPVPEYWGEISLEEKAKCKGNVSVITETVKNVRPESISKYLTEWQLDQLDSDKRAYPDDEFAIGNCWQMCDFMRKLALEYPMDDSGKVLGDTIKFWTKPEMPIRYNKSNQSQIKPWWKFW